MADPSAGDHATTPPFAACTIIARNYLSHARILATSFLRHHPLSRFYLLVVDDLPSAVDAGPGIIIIDLRQLRLPDAREMAFKYDVTEFSTAVKPWLMSTLMTEFGEKAVVYLDPDIMVMRPLTAMAHQLAASDIILIPHLLQPIPIDGRRPSEQDILVAGAFNLGFIAVRTTAETVRFLAWWQDRLWDHCRKSPPDGLMVDQKWIDLVPGLFPGVTLLRDETYNVAYWNLNSRTISSTDGVLYVNDEPLSFFHFSGFNPLTPSELSKYQDRLHVADGSALAALLAHYADLHIAASYKESSGWEYGYDRFKSGLAIHWIVRAIYSEMPPADRTLFGDPFDDASRSSFFAWVTQPRDSALSPFLERLYELRPDVRAAFPDALGKDRDSFVHWARHQGSGETGFDPVYVQDDVRVSVSPADAGSADDVPGNGTPEAASGSIPPRLGPASQRLGVNVVGYLRNESGVGAAGRGYIRALRQAGIPVAPVDVSNLSPNRSADDSLDLTRDERLYCINLLAVNADQHFVVADYLGNEFFDGRYNIGVWQWELQTFPEEWHDRFRHYDEVWAGSSFVANSIAASSPVPVVRVPPPLTGATPGSRERGRARLSMSADETLFAFAFDFHSYFERKNPMAVVAAFREAFPRHERARLVIKCTNSQFDPVRLNALHASIGNDDRISIYAGYWSTVELADLMEACDAYVSLHRAEGIGLTLSHAMSLGKPVIATGWSGNVDFMSAANSLLVRYDLIRITEDIGPYRAGEVWAEPSIKHAAELMRLVYDNRDFASVIGSRACADITSLFSVETVAAIVGRRIEAIHAFALRDRRRAASNLTEPGRGQVPGDTEALTNPNALDGLRKELRDAEDMLRHGKAQLSEHLATLRAAKDKLPLA